MIYTITPNPALDLGGIVDQIVPDEKNYVQDETRYPGGNAINVARLISSLRVPVVASGFLGGGIGEEIRLLLDQEKVRHDFIPIQGHTRMSVTVSNQKTHRQTRLSFSGPKIQPGEVKRLMTWIGRIEAPAILVIGGSLPPGFSAQHLKRLIREGHRKGLPVIVDVPGKMLKEAVKASPFFIKPNLTEFQQLTGKKVKSIPEVVREARKLSRKIPLVCVSSVEGGAVLVTPRSAWYGCGPKVKAKSTVGAGDSMVGAITAELWQQKVLSAEGDVFERFEKEGAGETLRWGIAAAMATVTTPGTQLGTAREIRSFCPKIKIWRMLDPGEL